MAKREPIKTLSQAEFVKLAEGSGYTESSAKELYHKLIRYTVLKKEMTALEVEMIQLSQAVQRTVQVPELRITYNSPEAEYDYIQACKDLGINYRSIRYVTNFGPLARAAFLKKSALDISRMEKKYRKEKQKKPSIQLRAPEAEVVQ